MQKDIARKNPSAFKKIEKDFTNGPLFKQIILFSLPIIFSNVIQSLYSTADITMLGVLVGDDAVASVGSTSALVNLMISMFLGLSVGVNVVVSKCLGANDSEGARKTVGMSVVLSFIFGCILMAIGWFGARFFLTLMKSDQALIDSAVIYLRIYFLGSPILMLYNFLSAVMRAAGDSKRPLIFILIGGVVNVILNALFITVFDMTVEGVAIATVVSNGISALLCAITLIKAKGVVNLSVKYLKFFKKEFIEIVKVGVPVGVQSSLLTFSNVLIQSSVNLCGKSAVSGSSYAYQIEMYVYRAMHGISLATTSVVSQNNGAKNYQRIKTAVLYSALTVSVLGISLSVIATALCKPILTLVSGDSAVIGYAVTRMFVACLPYFLCGVMEILSYSLRALGKSMESVVICLFGSFVIITVWITTVFKLYQKYALIFFAYPVSWLVTSALLLVVLLLTFKTLKEKYKNID